MSCPARRELNLGKCLPLVAIIGAHRKVRSRALGDLVSVADNRSAGIEVQDPGVAERVAWAVLVASNHGLTRPTCLVRSLAIQQMLRDRGLPPGQIKIGVRWQDDEFLAHAWVEQGDRVLGDSPSHVATFDPVTDMRMVRF